MKKCVFSTFQFPALSRRALPNLKSWEIHWPNFWSQIHVAISQQFYLRLVYTRNMFTNICVFLMLWLPWENDENSVYQNLVKIATFGWFWWVVVHDFWLILVNFWRFRGTKSCENSSNFVNCEVISGKSWEISRKSWEVSKALTKLLGSKNG